MVCGLFPTQKPAPWPPKSRVLTLSCLCPQVCRVWRNVSRSEEIWECVAKDLFPVLQLQGGALEPLMARGGRRRSYREYVMDYGRCLLRREIEIGDPW